MNFYVKATFYTLLISVLLISFVQSKCKILINEVNINDPKKPGKQEFVELMSTCGPDISLRGYKLVGFNCQSTSGAIDMVITLWNYRINRNGFFTISGSEVQSDLKDPSDYIKFRSMFDDKKVNTISNFIVKKELRAFGLLHDEKQINAFSDFSLSKKVPSIKITDESIEQLKKYLIDLVVYGEKNVCDQCKLFEKMNHEFASKKYILRDFPMNSAKKDISLNRCAVESTGFLPEKFKIGNPTPGKSNDCTGPNFLLEDFIPVNVLSAYVDDYDESASCSNLPTCTPSIQPINSDENIMIEQELKEANETSTRDRCTSLMLYPDGSNTALSVEQDNSRKRNIGTEHDYSEDLEWQTTKFFRFVNKVGVFKL